jgi:hypothetical protein
MKRIKLFILIGTIIPTLALGDVLYRPDKDDFTGKDNSNVQLRGTSKEFLVAWKCLSNGLNVALAHGYLGGDIENRVVVQTKFDDNPPSDRHYYSLQPNNVITLFDLDDVPEFTADTIASETLMVRIIDLFDNDSMTGSFETDGLQAALAKLPCYP